MPKRTREYRDSLLADLQDPAEAAAYLNAALEDSEEMLLLALRDVAAANQMAKVAADAGVARETVYRMLSKSGNPTFSNLCGVLNALGLRICFITAGASSHENPVPPMTSKNSMGAPGQKEVYRGAKKKGP